MNEKKAIEQFGESCQGLRPDIFPALNTFIPLKRGRVFLKPNGRAKGAPDNAASRRKALQQRSMATVESRETELCEAIDAALESGWSIPGFLALSRTPSGAVKAIPHKGATIVAASSLALARMIDRELLNPPDVMALLGLVTKTAPMPKAKKSTWVRVGGFADLGKNS